MQDEKIDEKMADPKVDKMGEVLKLVDILVDYLEKKTTYN
jgi:hypothetical protein